MTSDDVIHDFYIPAFRVKKDVVPGRYTSLWFQATEDRHVSHFLRAILRHGSRRNDRLGVRDVADRLRGMAFGRREERIHGANGRAALQRSSAASLATLRTAPVAGPLWSASTANRKSSRSGDMRVVDETLIRQAIVNPNSISLPNYPPIMPTFQGQINEEQVLQLIAYVKSLGPEERKTNGEMSTTAIAEPPGHDLPAGSRVNYLNANYGMKSWLLTTDHKRIALLYLGSITLMFFVGGIFAVLMRLHLIEPQGALVAPETYNKLFTMHGIIMVFFFLVPSIPATLGNFLVPMMIGARDLAFPRLNLLSWYIYIIGACFTLYAVISGGVDTGWTFYTPYSSTFSHTSVIPTALGIFITGFSSILTGLNFIVTIHKMRAPGHDLVPLAALHLGDVRHQHHLHSGHAGDRHHPVPAGPRTPAAHRHLRPGHRRRSRSCSSIFSGSIRTRPCTS